MCVWAKWGHWARRSAPPSPQLWRAPSAASQLQHLIAAVLFLLLSTSAAGKGKEESLFAGGLVHAHSLMRLSEKHRSCA